MFHGGEITMGGYSNNIVVDEHFVVKIPDGAAVDEAYRKIAAGEVKFRYVIDMKTMK